MPTMHGSPTVHVSTPKVRTGEFEVSRDAYLDQVLGRFPAAARDRGDARTATLMIKNLGVNTQLMSHPLDSDVVAGGGRVGKRNEAALDALVKMAAEVAGEGMVGKRNEASLDVLVKMAAEVVDQVLAANGVDPESIDAVALSNVTYWGSPGIISHLIEACGLRRDVDKIEMGSAACAGGATCFARGYDYIAAYPDRRVLVVVPERLSTIVHGTDTKPMRIVYGGSFSDVAAASIMSGYREDDRELCRSLGPGMVITHRHEFQLPKSLRYYFSTLDAQGKGFDSEKKALKASGEIIPDVIEWMKGEGIATLDWVALHPGSAAIIRAMAEAFGIDPDVRGMTRHSHKSLETGNKGGAGVFDVLRLTGEDPPAHGSPGAVFAVGPGFNAVICNGFYVHG